MLEVQNGVIRFYGTMRSLAHWVAEFFGYPHIEEDDCSVIHAEDAVAARRIARMLG